MFFHIYALLGLSVFLLLECSSCLWKDMADLHFIVFCIVMLLLYFVHVLANFTLKYKQQK